MDLATANSHFPRRLLSAGVCLCLTFIILARPALASDPASPDEFRVYAQAQYRQAQDKFSKDRSSLQLAWQFGRACFDLADSARDRTERADIAQQGIAACRLALTRDSNSAPAHYYLGMNLGQLARTKGLSALKIVNEMQQEFSLARLLDETFDYAGPDRNLGLLYRDTPAVLSIGNRSQGRQHLQRAVALASSYPENRLNLIEAFIKWGEVAEARTEFTALEAIWPAARDRFKGPAWAASWADWEQRRHKWRKKVEGAARTLEAPRNKP